MRLLLEAYILYGIYPYIVYKDMEEGSIFPLPACFQLTSKYIHLWDESFGILAEDQLKHPTL